MDALIASADNPSVQQSHPSIRHGTQSKVEESSSPWSSLRILGGCVWLHAEVGIRRSESVLGSPISMLSFREIDGFPKGWQISPRYDSTFGQLFTGDG